MIDGGGPSIQAVVRPLFGRTASKCTVRCE
jgi:hypothetical protein